MARTILLGRAGSPGVGIGRLLVVAPPVAAASRFAPPANGRGPATAAAEHGRLADALDRCATELEALAVADRGPSRRGGRRDLRGPGAVRARPRASSGPAFALVAAGSSAERGDPAGDVGAGRCARRGR